MDGNSGGDPIFPEDRPYAEGKLPPIRRFKFASPAFLHTMGNPLLAGRDFTWTDLYDKAPVAIVTENLARESWREPSAALGKRIRNGADGPWCEIIGVVGNERDEGVNRMATTTVYWPSLAKDLWGDGVNARRTVAFAILSSRTGSDSFPNEIRQAIGSVNANPPLFDVRTLDEIYSKSMGADFVYAGDARGGRRKGAVAGRGRHLRRDFLLGIAANARDRYQHGAGRAPAGVNGNVRSPWIGPGGDWGSVRIGGGGGADAIDVVAAVRNQSGRSGYVWSGSAWACLGCRAGELMCRRGGRRRWNRWRRCGRSEKVECASVKRDGARGLEMPVVAVFCDRQLHYVRQDHRGSAETGSR
jgi:hypothetical protein